MKSLQVFFQYAYLFVAVFFGYTAYAEYKAGETGFWIFILLSLAALGMFFFKKYMINKYRR